jgi:hypothetical protein
MVVVWPCSYLDGVHDVNDNRPLSMNRARSKRRRKPNSAETLDLTALPNSVVRHYHERAQKLNMSVSEYLVLKLTHDCFVDVTVETPPKRPVSGSAVYASMGVTASRSGYKGVYAYGKRWAAVVFANGARQRLGVWATPEEAARAYDKHLVVMAGGDLNAAVNFPGPLDDLQAAGEGFVERFASGEPLTDIEHAAWQRATQNRVVPERGPMSILPAFTDAAKVSASTPLMNRPAVGLYRRDSAPRLPDPEPPVDFVSPPIEEDPDRYGPDDDV